jgi:hypothetical protein
MPWLYLLLALAAFAVAFKTTSVAVLVICLVIALGMMLAWVMALIAQRVGSQSRDTAMMIDPEELRRMRAQAEARRSEGQTPPSPPASS